ncbi:MAG: tRNA (adenosine(37)-N6)-dimethylallyltransferase MiaA [Comamonadaceae bacterium]|nr:MAG: tRNA (adenosine(37)-N6)-dimethylallyltransferase MiaA [Comamonadaceae bacterium]
MSLRYLALAGPTASGKTAAALAIAQTLETTRPVEIISVDSALVYRGMDIGTAKPDAAELAAAPHHLIDIRDPLHAYSAAEFVADAHRLIGEITARGRLPLLVGGTMLYFKALFDGLDDMPKADAAIRSAIAAEALEKGWPAMHAELAQVDAVTAARLAPNDSQRVSRALEVFRVSGKPLSAWQLGAARPAQQNPGDTPLISLEPDDRAWLHARIAQRFDAMLAARFIDEVKALRARGDLNADLPSMRCVGYRQAWEMLDALESPTASPETRQLGDLREKGIAATRQLAKRQVTWLRSMPQRQIVACDAPDAQRQVLDIVHQLLAGVERSGTEHKQGKP